MHALSCISIALVAIAARCVRGEGLTGPDTFVDSEGQDDLFSNTFDLSPNDNPAPEDPNWVSLQPVNGYTSENIQLSSQPSDSPASYEPSPCLGDYNPPDIFGRSDDSGIVDNIVPPDFCFQNPDQVPSTEKVPLTIPNLLDLFQPGPENLIPSDTFPRRPVCPGIGFFFRLCCSPGGRTGYVFGCVICTYMLFFGFFTLFQVSSHCLLIWS